jgi:uncharacterized protein (DUF1697 family)
MTTWIALFRGINVGGNNILPMAELRAELEALGLGDVRSYIQSGNVVFESKSRSAKALGTKISKCVEEHHGFRPRVFVLTREELQAACDANPFPKAVSEPKTLHYAFLAEAPKAADVDALDALCSKTETWELSDAVFYLHAPDGIGRSKLAAVAEKHLGVATTGRNHRTVAKLLEMVEAS